MAEKTEKWKAARTKNLTAAQMKQARRVVGGKRSEAVSGTERKAAKKAVDISGTKWMTASERGGKGRGGLLVDSSGKAVTGTVTLPSGQKATYVRGKRIGVVAGGGGKGKGQGGGGGGGGGTKPTPPVDNYKTASRMGKPGEYQAGEGMRSKAGSVKNRQGKFQITGSSSGGTVTPKPSSTGVKRPIPYTDKGLFTNKEAKLRNQINIEKQRLRQARERARTKTEVSAAEAASRKRMAQLEAELRRLRSS
jgi:hypothetical protein